MFFGGGGESYYGGLMALVKRTMERYYGVVEGSHVVVWYHKVWQWYTVLSDITQFEMVLGCTGMVWLVSVHCSGDERC